MTCCPSSFPAAFFKEWPLFPERVALGLGVAQYFGVVHRIETAHLRTSILAPNRKVSTSSDNTASMIPMRFK